MRSECERAETLNVRADDLDDFLEYILWEGRDHDDKRREKKTVPHSRCFHFMSGVCEENKSFQVTRKMKNQKMAVAQCNAPSNVGRIKVIMTSRVKVYR
jgi:hypothetical protein